MRILVALSIIAAALPAEALQASEKNHRAVFEKTVASVVGVRAMAPLGERSGSGVVVSKDGYILTSYSTVPEGSERIRVYFHGPRLLEGKLVRTSRAHELSLIKVEPKGDLVPIEFADSSSVRVGEVSYTIGNASNSIINNDAASLGVGVISAIYTLRESRANSTYVGSVLETTAAVNVGMEGSPLLDASGRMVGFVTLNYSPHRFLGNAIPLNLLKPVVERLKAAPAVAPGDAETTLGEGGEGFLGLNAVDREGKVVVDSVDPGSPADRSGLSKGTVLLSVGASPLKNAADLTERLKGLKAGDLLFLKVEDGGQTSDLKIQLAKRK
jgi:serine protease Do